MSAKHRTTDDDEDFEGLVPFVQNAALTPFRVAVSKPAQRAYLTSFLVLSTSFLLLGLAIIAYTLFYWSYIPRIGFERTIHLQFDNVYNPIDTRYGFAETASPYPYGTVALSPEIVSSQKYDVAVELSLPRSPENTDAGNFMIEATMYAPPGTARAPSGTTRSDEDSSASAAGPPVLASSRRSTTLTYRSTAIDLTYKLTGLHWYILGFQQEAEQLRVHVFDGVEFAKGWRNLPATMKVEVQSTHRLQIYGAKAIFRARFAGLRWLMYNHRVLSALVFISGFWTTELLFAGLAWAAIHMFVATPNQNVKAEDSHEAAGRPVKSESNADDVDGDVKAELSDTERTFPTLGQQLPLRYARPEIKQENEESAEIPPVAEMVHPAAVEADDEDEDADFFLDSGLGTSMESSANRRDSVKKRRGRRGSREGG